METGLQLTVSLSRQAPGRRLHLQTDVESGNYTRVNTVKEFQAMVQDNFLLRRSKTSFELIDSYEDSLPFLGLRKAIMRIKT